MASSYVYCSGGSLLTAATANTLANSSAGVSRTGSRRSSSLGTSNNCGCKSFVIPCKDAIICYVEQSFMDEQSQLDDVEEVVWDRMRPPRLSDQITKPLITARQIDVVRAKLLGIIGSRAVSRGKMMTSNAKRKAALQAIAK